MYTTLKTISLDISYDPCFVVWDPYICTSNHGDNGDVIHLWTDAGKLAHQLRGHTSYIEIMTTWKDRLCSTSYRGEIRIWMKDSNDRIKTKFSRNQTRVIELRAFEEFLFLFKSNLIVEQWNDRCEPIHTFYYEHCMFTNILRLPFLTFWNGYFCENRSDYVTIWNVNRDIIIPDIDPLWKERECVQHCVSIWNDHFIFLTSEDIKCIDLKGILNSKPLDRFQYITTLNPCPRQNNLCQFQVWNNHLFGVTFKGDVNIWEWRTKSCIQTLSLNTVGLKSAFIKDWKIYTSTEHEIVSYQLNFIQWNTKNHNLFPSDAKRLVMSMLMMAARNSNDVPYHSEALFYTLPKDILYIIISYCLIK